MRNNIQNFPVENGNKSIEEKGDLSDGDIAQLLKKSYMLPNDERKRLFDLVSQLEKVDPMKIKRINKILGIWSNCHGIF